MRKATPGRVTFDACLCQIPTKETIEAIASVRVDHRPRRSRIRVYEHVGNDDYDSRCSHKYDLDSDQPRAFGWV